MIVGPTFAERLAESHIAKATKITMMKIGVFAHILPNIFISSCAPDILDAFCILNEKSSLPVKTRIITLKKAHQSYMAIYDWSRGSETKWDQQVEFKTFSTSF